MQHSKLHDKQDKTRLSIGITAALLGVCLVTPVALADNADKKRIKELESRVDALADALDNQSGGGSTGKGKTHIGGYGELHYRLLDVNGEDQRELDFHRMVLFVGHDFNEKARFVTELEVEHILASGGSRGAVEVEQAYVEMDLKSNTHLKTGVMLMPIGLVNETHEPPTFYGVERPVIESTYSNNLVVCGNEPITRTKQWSQL